MLIQKYSIFLSWSAIVHRWGKNPLIYTIYIIYPTILEDNTSSLGQQQEWIQLFFWWLFLSLFWFFWRHPPMPPAEAPRKVGWRRSGRKHRKSCQTCSTLRIAGAKKSSWASWVISTKNAKIRAVGEFGRVTVRKGIRKHRLPAHIKRRLRIMLKDVLYGLGIGLKMYCIR